MECVVCVECVEYVCGVRVCGVCGMWTMWCVEYVAYVEYDGSYHLLRSWPGVCTTRNSSCLPKCTNGIPPTFTLI